MRKSRFTESRIMAVLRQAESGVSVPELCREHGISTASFYKWRSKYGAVPCLPILDRRKPKFPSLIMAAGWQHG